MSSAETAQRSSNLVAKKVFEIWPLLMIWAWICLTLLMVLVLENCNRESSWSLGNLNFERADESWREEKKVAKCEALTIAISQGRASG